MRRGFNDMSKRITLRLAVLQILTRSRHLLVGVLLLSSRPQRSQRSVPTHRCRRPNGTRPVYWSHGQVSYLPRGFYLPSWLAWGRVWTVLDSRGHAREC